MVLKTANKKDTVATVEKQATHDEKTVAMEKMPVAGEKPEKKMKLAADAAPVRSRQLLRTKLPTAEVVNILNEAFSKPWSSTSSFGLAPKSMARSSSSGHRDRQAVLVHDDEEERARREDGTGEKRKTRRSVASRRRKRRSQFLQWWASMATFELACRLGALRKQNVG